MCIHWTANEYWLRKSILFERTMFHIGFHTRTAGIEVTAVMYHSKAQKHCCTLIVSILIVCSLYRSAVPWICCDEA